jgi:hypothetical protein
MHRGQRPRANRSSAVQLRWTVPFGGSGNRLSALTAGWLRGELLAATYGSPVCIASTRAAFAGIWTTFNGDRGTKSKPIPRPHNVYGFLTTSPNAVVAPLAQVPIKPDDVVEGAGSPGWIRTSDHPINSRIQPVFLTR